MYLFFTEIPGQYGQKFCKPQPEYHVKVTAFKPNVTIFASKQKPMKFSILGDDGKNYDFISKFGEGGYKNFNIKNVNFFKHHLKISKFLHYRYSPR